MVAINKFWDELSAVLGQPVDPETDLSHDDGIWDKLSPEKKEQVKMLIDLAMQSPNLMFDAEKELPDPAALPAPNLRLWKDVAAKSQDALLDQEPADESQSSGWPFRRRAKKRGLALFGPYAWTTRAVPVVRAHRQSRKVLEGSPAVMSKKSYRPK